MDFVDPELDDSYLWEKRPASPNDLQLQFPKPTLSFMVFRETSCEDSIEAVYYQLETVLRMFNHHYPFRCARPRIEIKKNKYRKSSKKKVETSYVYGELIYGDSTIDANLIEDVLFRLSMKMPVFIKMWDSESFETLLVRFYDDDLHDSLQHSTKSINRVWVRQGHIVTIGDEDIEKDDVEGENGGMLSLSAAVGYVMQDKVSKNETLSNKRAATNLFDDLKYIINLDTYAEDHIAPVYNKSPYLIPAAITRFIEKGLTLRDTTELDPVQLKAKPFQFSLGFLSYCELLALYTKRQAELRDAGIDPETFPFKMAIFQVLSQGMTELLEKSSDVVFKPNQDNLSVGFNNRLKLQDSLSSVDYIFDMIPASEDFIKETDEVLIQKELEEVQQSLSVNIEELLDGHSSGIPMNVDDIFFDNEGMDPLMELSSDEEEHVRFTDPEMAETFGKLMPVFQDHYKKGVIELKKLYQAQDSDDDEITETILRLKHDRRDVDDRYSQRFDEFLYFDDMNDLYAQNIRPSDDDFYMYYHPVDEKGQYYYDPHTLSAEEVKERYEDSQEYSSDHNDDLYHQAPTIEDYNQYEKKYIALKRKTNSEFRALLVDDGDDDDDDDYDDDDYDDDDGDDDDDDNEGNMEDRIIDVDNEQDAEVYRDIESEKKAASKFLIEEI